MWECGGCSICVYFSDVVGEYVCTLVYVCGSVQLLSIIIWDGCMCLCFCVFVCV